jgi:hypothetical protein
MVAGRRFGSRDEQHAAQHQTGGGGDLGVEAVEQHGARSGEARAEVAGVLPRRQVDQQDDGEAQRPEREDDAPKAPPPPSCRFVSIIETNRQLGGFG